ncbi:MAG: L-serine ammonia-lyase, iron-sulfur-dependent, subunit alpha [Eubacteriales bacterium]|nr:L-serine ammonia-lyase, iron-sulfur-dependent, subunit alpha [Eubacteriales bacterium]
MPITKSLENTYSRILNAELMTAMGCTEPIAIAFCSAYARNLLGKDPDHCVVRCSGNIIKNVKAVVVPQTGGLKGIEAAAAAGIVSGRPELRLEVLSCLTDEDRAALQRILETDIIDVTALDSGHALHIIVELTAGEDNVSVEVIDAHTNIGKVVKNGTILQDRVCVEEDTSSDGYDQLNIKDILEYAKTADLDPVRDVLERQILFNTAISEEGLRNIYGSGIGPALMKNAGTSLREHCKAAAAAGSDARMNGCSFPVVINSGSGNQGITVSLPVILSASEKKCSHDELLHALSFANLIAIRQKVGIGKLSAFCGATCAAIGAICGIAFLDGADYDTISQTIINGLATIGGMVCDGAKSSCAGKIASALDCAFTGYEVAKLGRGYRIGEGLVKDNVEHTIDSIARMAASGMHSTDLEVLDIMLEK